MLFLIVFGWVVASPIADWVRVRLLKAAATQRDEEERGVLQLAWAMLLLTLALPLLLGTTHSHGVDLLALMVPWCAVYAGVGLKRVIEVVALRVHSVFAGRGWARWGTLSVLSTLGWGLFVFPLMDTKAAYPEVETYYSWLVGGVDGACEMGLPRNPEGPLPPHFLAALIDPNAQGTLAILAAHPADGAVLERYRQLGLVPQGLTLSAPESADLALLRFDETQPDFERYLPDFFASVRVAPAGGVRWVMSHQLPLFGVVRLGD
jgi:hypothetical protein